MSDAFPAPLGTLGPWCPKCGVHRLRGPKDERRPVCIDKASQARTAALRQIGKPRRRLEWQ